MTSNSPFSGELIQQTTEAVGNFLRWIAELIVSRNWFSLLILLAVLGVFLLNPSSGLGLKFLGIDLQALPDHYARGFWLGEAGIVLAALAIAVRTMPRATPVSQADIADRKAIKGLRPFDSSDAPVFAQLQRQRNRRECLDSVTSRAFRFGILHGESGCGKTSFLQAGVLPDLTPDNTGQIGVYVRFSDREPILTIAKAIAEQLELPLDWLLPEVIQPDSFLSLLRKVTDNSDQPLVLLLDQFEQFFVHYKRKAQRQPFIQALSAWYRSDNPPPVKMVVSIRSDLMYQLDELHRALGYSLAPQEVFRLEKFTPTEACRVLEVISQTEGLDFNRAFVSELAQDELADREDGLISPVDVQILSWMIERQTTEELRAFNRNAFQKFGGVEGLLQRFLERTLEARVSEKQRQSAVKVLLALTDLDRQVRTGMLTAPELKEKLRGSAKTEEVAEAVTWLARGDVRLITPQEKEGEVAYELAHERLIPALMRQARKELSAADQANRLLDRRVNEWLENHCDKRYLFGLRELWLLDRQKPYLVWGAKREQKEKLLRRSRWRVYGGLTVAVLGVLLSSGGAGWLTFTPSGQILKIQWQLSGLLKEASSSAMVVDAAVAFAKNDQWNKAFDITERYLQIKEAPNTTAAPKDRDLATFINQSANFLIYATPTENKASILARLQTLTNTINDDFSKSSALRAIAAATVEIGNPAQAKEVLSSAIQAAQAIQDDSDNQDDSDKSSALSAIAADTVEIGDLAQAKEVLSSAIQAAQAIQDDSDNQDDSDKSSALSAIAAAYGEIGDPAQAKEVLSEAITAAQAIQSDFFKSHALSAIAAATVEIGDPAKAKAVLSKAITTAQAIKDDRDKSSALSDIAAAYGEIGDPAKAQAVLSKAISAAQAIRDDIYKKSSVLSAIAAATVEIGDPAQAKAVLSEALAAAQAIQYDSYKSSVLSAIAAATVEIGDPAQAKAVLSEALIAAQAIQYDSYKSDALRAIAVAYGEIGDPSKAKTLLSEAITAAAQALQSDRYKSYALSDIAAATVEIGNPEKAKAVLSKAITAAQAIQSDRDKSYALSAIAAAYGEIADPAKAKAVLSKAITAAQAIQSDSYKSYALSDIISIAISFTDNSLVQEFLKTLLRITHRGKTSVPMVIIANYYAKQANWFQALHALSPAEKREKIIGLSQMLTILAEHKTPKLIPGALVLPSGLKGIEVSGQPGNYTLTVQLQSPDESCERYADWWEVITPDGDLIARRVIETIHKDEQPFSDSLAAVDITADQTILIRAHFKGTYLYKDDLLVDDQLRDFILGLGKYKKSGYTNQALKGSIAEGFRVVRISENFAKWLEKEEPLPDPEACRET